MGKNYKPRLSIEITEEQRKELIRLIPWGMKSQLFSIIIDDVIFMLKKHKQRFLAAVLTRSLQLENYLEAKPQLGERKDVDDRRP